MRSTHPDSTPCAPLAARWLPWVALAIAVGLAGCGGDNGAPRKVTVYPVKGKVLLPGGKPLTSGTVTFVPTKDSVMNSVGKVDPDGSFTLATGPSGEGAPPGDYRVRIDYGDLPMAKTKKGMAVDTKNLPFPAKYTDEGSSGLTATVKAEPNEIPPFKLEPEKSGAKSASARRKGPVTD